MNYLETASQISYIRALGGGTVWEGLESWEVEINSSHQIFKGSATQNNLSKHREPTLYLFRKGDSV